MKVKKSTIIHAMMMIAMFAVLEPTGFIGTWVHTVCGYIRTIAFLAAAVIYFVDKHYRNVAENLILIILAWLGTTTIIYFGKLSDDCSFFIRVAVTSVIFLQYLYKRDAVKTCRDMGLMLSLFLLLDAMTWVLPGLGVRIGNSIKCFLGTKTTITYYFVPAIAFDYAYYCICPVKDKRKAIALFLLAFGGTIGYLVQMNISTTIVCLVLLIVFGVLNCKENNAVIGFTSKFGMTITIVVNVLFLAGTSIGLFDYIIQNVLKESGDLTGRYQLWHMAFLYITKRPLIGYGMSTGIYLDVWSATNVSAHNLFVGLLLKMGIIGIVLFLIVIIYFQKKNNEAVGGEKKLCLFMNVIMAIMIVEGISEDFFQYAVTFCALSLIGNSRFVATISRQQIAESLIDA